MYQHQTIEAAMGTARRCHVPLLVVVSHTPEEAQTIVLDPQLHGLCITLSVIVDTEAYVQLSQVAPAIPPCAYVFAYEGNQRHYFTENHCNAPSIARHLLRMGELTHEAVQSIDTELRVTGERAQGHHHRIEMEARALVPPPTTGSSASSSLAAQSSHNVLTSATTVTPSLSSKAPSSVSHSSIPSLTNQSGVQLRFTSNREPMTLDQLNAKSTVQSVRQSVAQRLAPGTTHFHILHGRRRLQVLTPTEERYSQVMDIMESEGTIVIDDGEGVPSTPSHSSTAMPVAIPPKSHGPDMKPAIRVSPTPPVTLDTAISSPPPSTSSSSGPVCVRVRFPDGTDQSYQLDKDKSLQALHHEVQATFGDDQFYLQTWPRGRLKEEDLHKTFQELSLHGNVAMRVLPTGARGE